MFTAALFIVAKTWKQPKCPSMEEWIKKMGCVWQALYFLILFYWLRRGMWDLSSQTRDRTWAPCMEALSINHWSAMEFPRWGVCVCKMGEEGQKVQIPSYKINKS